MPLWAKVDQATRLLPQKDPVLKWSFTAGQNKRITRTVSQNIKSLVLEIDAEIDTGATAPGRSADSPYDMVRQIQITGGATRITYKYWNLLAMHHMWEKQDAIVEDKPTVSTSQTDDACGFTIILPCPIRASGARPVEIAIDIQMATDAQLDQSSGSNYSNFDGTVRMTFIPDGERSDPLPPMVSIDDEDDGSGALELKLRQNRELYLIHLTDEINSPSAPSAGADETKYHDNAIEISWDLGLDAGGKQLDNIPTFKQLTYFSSAQNNVSRRTGHYTLRVAETLFIAADNAFELDANGTDSKCRLFALGSPDEIAPEVE